MKNPILNNSLIKKINYKKSDTAGYLLTYFIIIGIGFIYCYPVIYMIVNSIMSPEDLVDPSKTWVPSGIYWDNFAKAFETLDFSKSFLYSVLLSFPPAILQTASTAFIAFGLARFDFPLKKMWIVLVVATFVIPAQVTLIPRYVLYYQYGILNTVLPSYLPALLGQGLKSTIFILMFYSAFNSYPKAFDEAAEIDGAGKFKVFYKIALPMGKSIMILTILFSSIWYWNETEQSNTYFGSVLTTLPLQLQRFDVKFSALYGESDAFVRLNEAISLSGTLLSILPIVILYLIFQKQFVASIEQSGITGE